MTHIGETLSVALLVTSLASACGNDMDDDDAVAFGNQIRAARTEISRHHGAVVAAPTRSNMLAEVDYHDAQMSAVMDGMDGTMTGRMSQCSGSGMPRMHEMMGAMDTEMAAHGQNMKNTATLDEARERCMAHTESMDGMLDTMQAALGSMGCMGNH